MPLYQPNQTILNNQYKIQRELGAGAFGEVYLAEQEQTGVLRAIKIAHRDIPGFGSSYLAEAFERFRQEAKLGERLDHPNLIKVYGLAEDQDGLFLVMEFASGGSLADLLNKQKLAGQQLTMEAAVNIVKQISAGLAVLHNKQEPVVHRDLKPSNILFDQSGTAKIADFGLAQMPSGLSMRSHFGSLAVPHPGTPMYKSPEQENSLAVLKPVSDIYSLGLIFFELLTGVNYKMQRPGTRVSTFRAGVPQAVENLLVSMLAEDANQRPWDGAEVLAALENLSIQPVPTPGQTPIKASSPASIPSPKTVKPAFSTVQPQTIQQKPVNQTPQHGAQSTENLTPKKSKTWVWAAVVGLVILCLAVVGVGSAMGSRLFNKAAPTSAQPAPVVVVPTTVPTKSVSVEEVPTITSAAAKIQADTEEDGTQRTATVVALMRQSARETWQQGHLVFGQRSSGGAELVYFDMQTNQSVRSLASASSENYLLGASLSKDGNWAAYYEYPDSLYKISTGGSGAAQFVGSCQSPSWGDGGDILCRAGGNKFVIYSGGASSSVSGISGLMGDLSPQGTEIVYAVSEGGSLKIYKAGVNGGGNSLLAGESSENYAPSWSPDGQWIAYQSNQGSTNSEIWIMDANGGQKRKLTSSGGGWARGPAWSPDGFWIAFVSSKDASIGADFGEVYLVSVQSGEIIRVTNSGGQVYDWRIDWGR